MYNSGRLTHILKICRIFLKTEFKTYLIGENVELLLSRIAVISFCRDVIKEAETAEKFPISDDFVSKYEI